MEPLQIFLSFGQIITLGIAVAAFFRQGRKDSEEVHSHITELQSKVSTLQQYINASSITEMGAMKQSIDDLKKRLEKLDTDVEKKIDQISNKMDGLVDKMQELLIQISKR